MIIFFLLIQKKYISEVRHQFACHTFIKILFVAKKYVTITITIALLYSNLPCTSTKCSVNIFFSEMVMVNRLTAILNRHINSEIPWIRSLWEISTTEVYNSITRIGYGRFFSAFECRKILQHHSSMYKKRKEVKKKKNNNNTTVAGYFFPGVSSIT